MNKLKPTIEYICRNYSNPDDLSNARLNKIVYLADWRSCIVRNAQLTDIEWFFNHHGPYTEDIIRLAIADSDFTIISYNSHQQSNSRYIKLSNQESHNDSILDSQDIEIIDSAMRASSRRKFVDFINFIYSTYPITVSNKYTTLNLVNLAKSYRNIKTI